MGELTAVVKEGFPDGLLVLKIRGNLFEINAKKIDIFVTDIPIP
jgi:hypothetical protein